MAITETVRDIENYPNKTKTVVLDLQKVIPIDNEGDEVYVINSTTTALKQGSTAISQVFLREFKAGYVRSSGLKSPPFNIDGTNNTLRISIDGSTYRTITLSSGTGLSGDDIARDLESKITALAASGQLESGNTAYLNTTVDFQNNKFLVTAGSISNTFTGLGKSSVAVSSGLTNDATATLGLDINISSEVLASTLAVESALTTIYSGVGDLQVNNTSGLTAGQAFVIMDSINKEYFIASGIGANTITPFPNTILQTYPVGSLIQRIYERDPELPVATPYEDIDSIVRFALRGIANQIDFSI